MGQKIYANGQALCSFFKSKINIRFDLKKTDFGNYQYNGFFIEGFRKCQGLSLEVETFCFHCVEKRLMRSHKQSRTPTVLKTQNYFSVHLKFSGTLIMERKP